MESKIVKEIINSRVRGHIPFMILTTTEHVPMYKAIKKNVMDDVVFRVRGILRYGE